MMGPGPILTTSSIKTCNIRSIVIWRIRDGAKRENLIADAKLLWHTEASHFIPDSYAGGVSIQRDGDVKFEQRIFAGGGNPVSTPREAVNDLRSPMLLENRVLQMRATDLPMRSAVEITGDGIRRKGWLEEIPGGDWHDNATRNPCPACREFMPLGAFECFSWNCRAAYFYLQHRFTAQTEQVVIPKKFKVAECRRPMVAEREEQRASASSASTSRRRTLNSSKLCWKT